VETDVFKQVSLKRKKEREREILRETYYRGRSLSVSRIPVPCEHLEVYERVMAWRITLFRIVC